MKERLKSCKSQTCTCWRVHVHFGIFQMGVSALQLATLPVLSLFNLLLAMNGSSSFIALALRCVTFLVF